MGARRAPRRWLSQTVIGLVLLPLSVIPLWVYSTRTDSGRLLYLKGRYALFPPATEPLDAAGKRAALAHRDVRTRGVPVLVYHGIGATAADAEGSHYEISRDHFAEHMLALRAAGYRPIGTSALARYMRRGNRRGLPRRPVLITFDDGRVDAMLQGDRILRDSGMRATMFVIGKAAEDSSPYYEDWDSLDEYRRTGRWELAAHTYDLHHQRDGHGALVHRSPTESLGSYRERVRSDLSHADALLAERGARGRAAFAYPFSDWGQRSPREVRGALRAIVARRFAVAFDQDRQDDWRPALPGDDRLHIHRLSVENWSGEQLLRRLARGHARARAAHPRP